MRRLHSKSLLCTTREEGQGAEQQACGMRGNEGKQDASRQQSTAVVTPAAGLQLLQRGGAWQNQHHGQLETLVMSNPCQHRQPSAA